MIKCGINLNLNNLQGEITSQLTGFVNISSILGTPAGLTQVQSLLNTAVTSITSQVQNLIPAVPAIPQSLRNDLAELAALPAGGTAALAKIAQFVQDYTGLENISGFANLNLNDLASSVFSVSGIFDPCSSSFDIPSVPSLPNIPNIIKNPVTGVLEKLPAIQPDLGATVIAKAEKLVEEVADNFDEATVNNAIMDATELAETSLNKLQTNIQPAIEDAMRRLPTGEEVLEMQEDLVNRLKEKTEILKDFPLDKFGQAFADIPLTIPELPDPGSFLGTKPAKSKIPTWGASRMEMFRDI